MYVWTYFNSFHDEGPYHIESGPLICNANQWTGFYMIKDFHRERVKGIALYLSLTKTSNSSPLSYIKYKKLSQHHSQHHWWKVSKNEAFYVFNWDFRITSLKAVYHGTETEKVCCAD